jgi:tetratricopeptide (TPR) repeat protein
MFAQGLRRLGVAVPATGIGLIAALAREITIQAGHAAFPARLHRSPASKRRELAGRMANFVSCNDMFARSALHVLWAQLLAMNHCEQFPPSRTLSVIYAYHSCVASMLGWHSRGIRYGRRAKSLAVQLNDTYAIAQSTKYPGIGLYASARFEEALEELAEAKRNFEKLGEIWEVHLTRFHIGCCELALGNLHSAVEEARLTFLSSARVGDTRTMCSSWLWARATRGNFPYEEIQACHPCRPEDVMSNVHRLLAAGQWHLFHGRTAEAVAVLDEAATMARRTLVVNSHTILFLPMLASALRQHAVSLEPQHPHQADKVRHRGYRIAKWSARVMRLFPAAYPLALREWSVALAAHGKNKQALRVAEKSCAVAQRQKARFEYAQSLLVAGRIAHELDLPDAEQRIAKAEAQLDQIEGPLRTVNQAPRVTERLGRL